MGESLQRAAAFDDHAAAGRSGQPGHDRDRGGEDQRAGGRDHEHGDRAYRVAGEPPGHAGDPECDRQEERGVAVGEADERGGVGLASRHQPHDPGVGALGRGRGHPQVERRRRR